MTKVVCVVFYLRSKNQVFFKSLNFVLAMGEKWGWMNVFVIVRKSTSSGHQKYFLWPYNLYFHEKSMKSVSISGVSMRRINFSSNSNMLEHGRRSLFTYILGTNSYSKILWFLRPSVLPSLSFRKTQWSWESWQFEQNKHHPMFPKGEFEISSRYSSKACLTGCIISNLRISLLSFESLQMAKPRASCLQACLLQVMLQRQCPLLHVNCCYERMFALCLQPSKNAIEKWWQLTQISNCQSSFALT